MRPYPPLGILYLSAHLKARGFDVGVFDGTFQSLSDFSELLVAFRPPNRRRLRQHDDQAACAQDDGACPQRRRQVVVGGPDPPYYAAEYLAAGADVVVFGEGEATLEELIPGPATCRLHERSARRDFAGIAFRRDDRRPDPDAGTRRCSPISCAQPHPDRGAIDLDRYIATLAGAPRIRTCVAHHRTRLSVHLHVVQPLGLWHDASPPLGCRCRR